MKCEVQKATNIRFRILKIEGNTYILDMSESIWKIVFPFLTWILPHTIYKVDEEEINKKLEFPRGSQKKMNISILFIAGIGIFVGNLLTDLTDYFYIPSTTLVNSIIATFVMLLIILVRSLLSNRNKNQFYKLVAPNLLSKDRIFIRPMSLKHFIQCLFVYIFFLVFFIATFILFITDGNLMLIVSATIFAMALSVTNVLYVFVGHTTVKFKRK
ncbi:DUF443 family protein [Alkalihalobacterium chitinilyticum]|uniref:DUF443 domain-containing protein n=1 Tax=Alkalihalobacterium chitinilyticum TaxID=2980103 RepID=A0ABT5VLS8_9BACI|nr:DUF443 family protein [Alkalihalobacterium chitinilyticum]MDE5415229.1 DUF443 domain-containing protein [Alkalihalobacterium chitinilyticum]